MSPRANSSSLETVVISCKCVAERAKGSSLLARAAALQTERAARVAAEERASRISWLEEQRALQHAQQVNACAIARERAKGRVHLPRVWADGAGEWSWRLEGEGAGSLRYHLRVPRGLRAETFG
eukprot:3822395-Pleurochrysis_carterae.AAC.2